MKPSPETYRAKAMPVKPKNGSTAEILHHATAYGAWCTGMKNQLDTLTHWFEEKTQ
ncbi:hypothetical protein MIB43_015185 [Providencia rettgeri]|uniref:hypothetical protein n=1 Tax=Providencia rettgeri TaxID=587 RepID=UPI001F03C5E3|nr:hypothetical protein [Providencia rettgeri]MCG9951261.1 hypothetical protein [Providencia rettgeri]